jgi:hypothetical protein
MAYDISWNVVLFLDYLDQLDVSDGALDDLAAWIPGLKTDLPPNVWVVLSTLPIDRNKDLLRQAKLYMGDDSFVEVKLIYLPDEGVSRTAFGTMMELRASREVIVPNRRYSIVTSCSVDCSPFLFCCVVLGNCLIPIATCCWSWFEPIRPMRLPSLYRWLWMSSPRCVIVRDHNFFYTHWCILQWLSYADPASTMDSLFTLTTEGAVGVTHLILEKRCIRRRCLWVWCLSEKELEDILSCQEDVLVDVYEWWSPNCI